MSQMYVYGPITDAVLDKIANWILQSEANAALAGFTAFAIICGIVYFLLQRLFYTFVQRPISRRRNMAGILRLEVEYQRCKLAIDPNWTPPSPAQALLSCNPEKAYEVAELRQKAFEAAKDRLAKKLTR